MTATHSCFWALLSSEDFSFIYISNNVRRLEPVLGVNFIGSQLYGIVLPTEVPRMRKDLNVFKVSSSFNGAAIRCSAYNFATIQDSAPYQYQRPPSSLAALNLPYSTYTLMIQAITSQVTMAMFHIDEDFLNKKMTNSKVDCFHNYDHSVKDFISYFYFI
ncbi:hypothetical protein K502DRAFT_129591 [Neoconidiobolus thromboides FSU 785]|nr:hypothetical protein K502DRAFT_129591 [Neoconidiobolus thromboides FSU 785]